MKHHRESSSIHYIIGGVVFVVILSAAAFYFASSPSEDVTTNVQPKAIPTEVQGGVAIITYSSSGFTPSLVTIKKGDSVTFIDQGTGKMWVASNPHPDHTAYAGTARSAHCPRDTDTAFDQCGTGAAYSFTFEKSGTWKYHNHVIASHGGTVIVTE